jgi:rsbT co-antagonist protein RsbR
MTDGKAKIGASQAVIDAVWELQDVLLAASSGDYSKRCNTSINESFEDNPLSLVAPSINLLLSDLNAKRKAQARAEATLHKTVQDLERQLQRIEAQEFIISELSTPVLEVWDNVLVVPVIGVVDTKRSLDITDRMLTEIAAKQARYVILDVTGVDIVDTRTADYLIKTARAAELLGTSCVITGIQPAVAQTLIQLGVDLSAVTTLRSLQDGLRACLRLMDSRAG